ncbi:hypothetical protein HDU96_003471 [Phlyctochytrium bullatum]|nr:hypothetical protein HDU96_003471 [Phlyctochytrium bullatum]
MDSSAPAAVAAAVDPKTPPPSVHEEVMQQIPQEKARRIICIAVDGSDHSRHAFEWALKNLVHKPSESLIKDQVVLLNCRKYYPSPAYRSLDSLGDISVETRSSSWYDSLEEAAKLESHDLLKRFGARVLDADVPCRAIALRGDAREEILAKANELGADVIVCGTRGMSALKRVMTVEMTDNTTDLKSLLLQFVPNISLPPPPPADQCDPELQAKIAQWTTLRTTQNRHFNAQLSRTHSFANPAIMSKLIEFLGLVEYGTQLPRETFDPYGFNEDWYYDKVEAMWAREEEKAAAEAVAAANGAAAAQVGIAGAGGHVPTFVPPRAGSKWDVVG